MLCIYSLTVSKSQYVTAFQLLLSCTIDQLKRAGEAGILSVFNDTFLVSSERLTELYIYNRDCHYLSTITTKDNDKLIDATWIPCGNLIYTTDYSNVVVMLKSGEVKRSRLNGDPLYFSVCNDIIYLADMKAGVFHSTDEGISWSLALSSNDDWNFVQVIQVTTNHSDYFWSLLKGSDHNHHLCMYSVAKEPFEYNTTWTDISIITGSGKNIILQPSKLSYDGKKNIFLSDFYNRVVYVLSVNGPHYCQLQAPLSISNAPVRLAIDKERQLLYVGQFYFTVDVFSLKYDYEDNLYACI